MKSIQLLTKWVMTPSLVILMSLSITANKAHAGGYNDPDLLTNEERVSNMKTIPSLLSWEKWEKPYISGGNLCRRKNGDVICLPTIMARKVRAHIYSPPKSNASPTAKPK